MPAAIAAATALFSAITASAIGAALVKTAIGIGLSLIVNRLFAPASAQAPELKPQDMQSPIRQDVPPRIRSYGRVQLAGVVFWQQADTATGYLYLGRILNYGRIGGFVSYLIDNTLVGIDGSGNVLTSPYSGVVTKILTRNGAYPETAYAEIQSAFGYGDVRGDGCATALSIHETFSTAELQQENYSNGLPQLKYIIDASVVWDWRDPAQNRLDETTWRTSSNPVVCAMDYAMHRDGFAIPWERFRANLAEWTREADVCDELVAAAGGGSEARYRLALTYDYTQRPGDVMAQILRCCDGRFWPRSDGTMGISVNKFRGTRKTIGSDLVLGYRLRYGQDRLTGIAGVRGRYLDSATDYVEAEAEPWPDAATVLALGEDRVASLPLQMVPSLGQSRRLMELAFLQATSPRRLTLQTDFGGLVGANERFVRVLIPKRRIDHEFEVLDFQLDPNNGNCSIELAQHQAPSEAATSVVADAFRRIGTGASTITAASVITVNFTTTLTGDPPQVGDLAVAAFVLQDPLAWQSPSGWTQIGYSDPGALRISLVAKVLEAGDLAGPVTFYSSGSGAYQAAAVWAAFRNVSGTLASAQYAFSADDHNDPAPLAIDGSAYVGPALVVHAFHSGQPSDDGLTSAILVGTTPDGSVETSVPMADKLYHGIKMTWKLYTAGEAAESVSGDMSDEGYYNNLWGAVIYFT